MLAKPTPEEIANHVKQTLAGFARKNVNTIQDTDELTTNLGFTDEDFPFLAMSLRGYVQMFSNKTVKTTELKKAKDVKGTVKLVQDKLK